MCWKYANNESIVPIRLLLVLLSLDMNIDMYQQYNTYNNKQSPWFFLHFTSKAVGLMSRDAFCRRAAQVSSNFAPDSLEKVCSGYHLELYIYVRSFIDLYYVGIVYICSALCWYTFSYFTTQRHGVTRVLNELNSLSPYSLEPPGQ